MLYPFMTLPDDTEIVHSESYLQDGQEHVRVEIENLLREVFNQQHVFFQSMIGRISMDFRKLKFENFRI